MKILGLDLGTTSIGWALIEAEDNYNYLSLWGLGSRVIPYSTDTMASDFSKGKGESPCAARTLKRQMRRNIDRFQLHRQQLKDLLVQLGFIKQDYKTPTANPIEVWKRRADAATTGVRLSLEEIADVLFHINHRRGYRHSKSDLGDAKQTDYVEKINDRYSQILETGKTVGQYFYSKLNESEITGPNGKKHYNFRIKEQVCPRRAYEEEVKQILLVQSQFYPEILTEARQKAIMQVIFYQRPLKSCKNLVSYCQFERHEFVNQQGKTVESGPKVTPVSSPLAQICKIYESINNIRLVNSRRKHNNKAVETIGCDGTNSASRECRKLMPYYQINDEERKLIFDYLNTHEKITEKALLKILGLTSDDGFRSEYALGKGIQGNTTYCKIAEALGDFPHKEKLLQFEITEEIPSSTADADSETGEIFPRISPKLTEEPLYMLWHTLYSVKDKDELFKVLSEKFGIDDSQTLNRLYALDFVKAGYTNKSAKFMRKLIPLLKRGLMYSEACAALGVNHSDSLTREENLERELTDRLPHLYKGELRQPVVEKIINQTINVVNAIKDEFGEIDVVRVELARELKRDKKGREKMADAMSKSERENQTFAAEIAGMNIIPTRRRIQKMKMLAETGNKCMYCGQGVTPYQFIEGHGYDIEHIVPRSRMFDNSFTNKVCACRDCNAAKGARTAFDFMKSKSEQEFNSYLDRVEELYKAQKISKAKRDRLLMSEVDIPDDFIERDLRQTQYITRKSMEILSGAIRNVFASSGLVTDFFRHAWGYDTILEDINLPRYESAGLTEEVEYETHGQKHKAIRIKDWTKRKDHRHHALDALVVALTRQGYIQRLNTLNASKNESEDIMDRKGLDRWAAERPHIDRKDVIEALEKMSVSFKSGKKVITPCKRFNRKEGKWEKVEISTGMVAPRGALHKDTIYGLIKVYDGRKKLKSALQNVHLIIDAEIRQYLVSCLQENGGDIAKTVKSLKKNNFEFNGKSVETVECYREEIVVKYPITSIAYKDLKSIVDSHIRKVLEDRFAEVGNNDKAFVKSIDEKPVFSDKDSQHQIKSVRLFTGLNVSNLAGVRKNMSGDVIGYAEKRNNHHIAFYRKPDGKIVEMVGSFWDCVKREIAGLPSIITNPADAWSKMLYKKDNAFYDDMVKTLPPDGSEFVLSLQRNEMFVIGMSDEEWEDALASNDIQTINRHLYRVWKLSASDYNFKYHTSTTATIDDGDKEIKQYYRLTSISSLLAMHPRKVTVSVLGKLNTKSDDKENTMFQ